MIEQFAEYLTAERGYSPLTVRNYTRDLQDFFAFLGTDDTQFDATLVKRDDIRAWIESMAAEKSKAGHRPLSAASINRTVCSVRSLFKYLVHEGIVEQNPAAALPVLKTPKKLPSYIPEGQMHSIIDSLDDMCSSNKDNFTMHRNALIIVLLYGLGIRLAELIGINREDIAEDLSSIRVTGKGNKQRVIPLLPYVAEKINKYLNEIDNSKICISDKKALILSKKGERIGRTEVYRAVTTQLSALGVKGKCSPHVLRHTFATHLMNGGSDMREIQELMGHSSLNSTQVYTHNSIEQLREVYRKAHPHARSPQK